MRNIRNVTKTVGAITYWREGEEEFVITRNASGLPDTLKSTKGRWPSQECTFNYDELGTFIGMTGSVNTVMLPRILAESVGNIITDSYSLGVATPPTITYSSPNIILGGDGMYFANPNSDYSGPLTKFSPAGTSLECTLEETTYYLYAYHDGGSGVLDITANADLLHDGRYVTIATVIRTGIYFHTSPHDQLALGHVSKIQRVLEHTVGYRRMKGIELSVLGTLNLAVTAGTVALGGITITLDAIDSSLGDNLFFTWWNGAWNRTSITQLNNTQYQGTGGLATLANNYYAVNWIWRGVENQKHIYYLLGGQYKTQAEAEQSGPPVPPAWISSHTLFAGRAIFKQGVATPVLVQNAHELGYVFTGAVYHNATTDKQGDGPEYHHLTAAQFAALTVPSAYIASPTTTQIRDILISHGLMAAA